MVLQSKKILGGVSLYLSSAEVATLMISDGKVVKNISKRIQTKFVTHGVRSDHIRKVNISGSDKSVKSAIEEIRNKFSKRIANYIPASDAKVMVIDGGNSLHNIEKKTGATISVEKKSDGGKEDKQMIISGSEDAVSREKSLVMDVSRIFLTNDEVNKLILKQKLAMKEICRITKASIDVNDMRMASVFGLKEAKEMAILMIRNLQVFMVVHCYFTLIINIQFPPHRVEY